MINGYSFFFLFFSFSGLAFVVVALVSDIILLTFSENVNQIEEAIVLSRDNCDISISPNREVKMDRKIEIPDFPKRFANTPIISFPRNRLSKSSGT